MLAVRGCRILSIGGDEGKCVMLQAVLFDLDDTLFDHRHSSKTALRVLQEQYPAVLGAVNLDELQGVNLQILNEVHIDVLNGSIDVETARQRRFTQLFHRYGTSLTSDQLSEISSLYRVAYQTSWRAASGAITVLTELRKKGIRIGIVSNNLVEEQMQKLRTCGLIDYIDSLTISEEAGVAKPDAQIFRIALERMGCSPNEVVMIGDAWENDIVPARLLGVRAIWFNSYGLSSPDENVPSITDFSDLNAVLRLICGMSSSKANESNMSGTDNAI